MGRGRSGSCVAVVVGQRKREQGGMREREREREFSQFLCGKEANPKEQGRRSSCICLDTYLDIVLGRSLHPSSRSCSEQ